MAMASESHTDDGGVSGHERECEREDCTERRPKWELHAGFCSDGCRHRAKGAEVFELIKHDKRLCATCFRSIRVIDTPSDGWIDAHSSMVSKALDHGASLTTADTTEPSQLGGVNLQSELDYTGVTYGKRPIDGDAVIGRQYQTEHTIRTPWGWSCECGNTDHRHREPAIIDVDLEAVITFLYQALVQLFREGHIEQSPRREALFDGLREEWKDWEYAIGRCLHE